MKNIITILFLVCALQSIAQTKGFYYSIGISTVAYSKVNPRNIYANIGYSFGANKLSIHNQIGNDYLRVASIEHNYQHNYNNKIACYSIAGLTTFNKYYSTDETNRIYNSKNNFAFELGLGFKYYLKTSTALNLSLRQSVFSVIDISNKRDVISPLTISLGISK
jgi:opacity protein-like surface antigen